jgi:general stress protein 26
MVTTTPTTTALTHPDIAKVAELIKDIQIAMLTTDEGDGTLRSRPMATQKTEFDGSLWFFTQIHSGKVAEIQTERHVNVSYANTSKQSYVSISGTGTILQDRAKAAELWSPLLKAWFPKGLDDPTLALLRVDVTEAEYWEAPPSAVVRLVGFVKAIATGEQYLPGEHARIKI